MKVKELIAALEKHDAEMNLPVVTWIGENAPEYTVSKVGVSDDHYDDEGNRIAAGPVLVLTLDEV